MARRLLNGAICLVVLMGLTGIAEDQPGRADSLDGGGSSDRSNASSGQVAEGDAPPPSPCEVEPTRTWPACVATVTVPPFNDPVFSDNDLYNDWWAWAIEAPAAWARETGNADVLIAVVDDGAMPNHDELVGKIPHQGSWHNTDGTFIEEDFFSDAYFGHGTPIAAIIAGVADNGAGSVGVCPDCSLMPMQIRYTGDYSTSTGSILWGLIYSMMADPKPRVINLSIGDGDYDAALISKFLSPDTRATAARTLLSERADYIKNYFTTSGDWDLFNISFDDILTVSLNENILVVVAAGNQAVPGDLLSICAHAATLCVGNVATRYDGTIAPSPDSNYGFSVQVSAPGTYIWAADTSDAGYGWHNGTSVATPIVSGLAGLLVAAHPDLTAVDIKQIIIASAVELDQQYDGAVRMYAGGRAVADEVAAWRRAFLRLLGKDETLLLDGNGLRALIDIVPYEQNDVWQRSQLQAGEDAADRVTCARDVYVTQEDFLQAVDDDTCAKAVGPLINARRALDLAAAGSWQARFASFSAADLAAAAALDPAVLARLADEILVSLGQ
ncbi:MAG: S8 family serine peptidase [Alphaproteobacteria bacterium]|jgi:subtilisin family serine protease|nr:S8 family serine peptidase [Alphaproteobacteria bacterium]